MFGQYRLGEAISNAVSLIYTKLFFPGARLIRRPFYLRGGKGRMVYGSGLTTGYACRFDLGGGGRSLIIGSNVKMNDRVHIVAHESVFIGDNVLMASNIFISDTSHGDTGNLSMQVPPDQRQLVTRQIRIGTNTWIGEGVTVLPGVTIGEGCVIGAGAVVVEDIPSHSVAVGVPARVVKRVEGDSCIA